MTRRKDDSFSLHHNTLQNILYSMFWCSVVVVVLIRYFFFLSFFNALSDSASQMHIRIRNMLAILGEMACCWNARHLTRTSHRLVFFCSFSASSIHMWHTHFAHVDQCLKFNPSAMFSFGLCTTKCIMLFLFILSFFLVVVPHCSLSSNTRNVQRSLSFYSCVECHIWAKICSDFNYWHIARCSWTTYTTFVCEQWIYRLNERQLVRRFALYET